MKKNLFKTYAFAAVVALVGMSLTSCGGGSSSDSDVSDIPTDGILGDLPMLTAKYCDQVVDLREKMFSDQLSEDEQKKAKAEFDQLREEQKAKMLLGRNALDGKEIPVEVQDGVPTKVEGTLKIDGNTQGSLNAIGTGEYTEGMSMKNYTNYVIVPIDKDGKAIETKSRGGLFGTLDGVGAVDGKPGEKVKITAFVSGVGVDGANSKKANDMKRWAKLAKYVIMDKTTDAYKQLDEQLKAEKKQEELDAAKKVAGE